MRQGDGMASSLELDLLRAYTREWYEALLSWQAQGSGTDAVTRSVGVSGEGSLMAAQPVVATPVVVPSAPAPAVAPAPPAPAAAPAAPAAPAVAAAPPAPAAPAAPAVAPAPPAPAADEVPALNDRFSTPERVLGEVLSGRPAEDLRRLIDVNERFLFTRELFDGNSDQYGQAISSLNEQPTQSEALRFFDTELTPRHQWDPESKVVRHLRDILEQRYRS